LFCGITDAAAVSGKPPHNLFEKQNTEEEIEAHQYSIHHQSREKEREDTQTNSPTSCKEVAQNVTPKQQNKNSVTAYQLQWASGIIEMVLQSNSQMKIHQR